MFWWPLILKIFVKVKGYRMDENPVRYGDVTAIPCFTLNLREGNRVRRATFIQYYYVLLP